MPSDDSEPLRGYATWLLTQSANQAHHILNRRLTEVGARGYHFRTLVALDRFGSMSQADLGRQSGIHLSDMVATLNQLGASGHIERSSDPTDRRRNVITITDSGRRRLQQLRDRVDAAQEDLLTPLTTEDRTRLRTILARLIDHHTSTRPNLEPQDRSLD